MVTPTDMDQHFTEVSLIYRDVRTTDRDPVERIAVELNDLPHPKGVDIGCGDGRYDLLMFETIAGLNLTCIDVNREMLDQARQFLAAFSPPMKSTPSRRGNPRSRNSNWRLARTTSWPRSTRCITSIFRNS